MEKIEKSNTKDVFLWDLKDILYEIKKLLIAKQSSEVNLWI